MKKIYHVKERDNRGLSLLELIAVIAIMAVLTGLLVPMFGKYISDKRTMGCEENREAILNVFEKCVYGTGTEETLGGGQQSIIMATDHDIKLLLSASTGGESDYNNLVIPAEYKEEIKSHYYCPDGGTITVAFDETAGVAYCYCTCTDHEDVKADMQGWSGVQTEGIDAEFDVPTVTVTPTPTEEPTPTPTDTPTPTPHISDSYWPYPDDPDWDSIGRYQSSKVRVTAPSGKFASRTKNGAPIYYVVVDRNNTGYLEISWEHAEGPNVYVSATGGTEDIVQCSGAEYDAESIWSCVSPDDKSKKGTSQAGDAQFYVTYGDIYSPDGGTTRFIYNSMGTGVTKLPPAGTTAHKWNNWCLMGPDVVD